MEEDMKQLQRKYDQLSVPIFDEVDIKIELLDSINNSWYSYTNKRGT